MTRYILRRILYAIPTLIGVSLLTYVIFFGIFTPQELARNNLSTKNPTADQINVWVKEHGYDKPPVELFENHMKSLLFMEFGKSDKTKEPIWDRIKQGGMPSLELSALAFFATLGIGLALAVIVAYLRGTYIDTLTMAIAVILMSIPLMVYVIAVQYLFGKAMRLGPLAGYESGFAGLRFLVLPILVFVISNVSYYVRLYRTFLLEEMNLDYVRTARAKGVPDKQVLFKHVLKNAMIPVVTTTVSAIPALILGNVVLESFFGIPGIGNYMYTAIQTQDFAVVRAMVYLGTFLYIIGLIFTDILYAMLDPRVRLS